MADARFDITTLKPVLAYVGATDLAVGKIRGVVADAQKRVVAVQKQATDPQAIREAIEARVAAVQNEALAYPGRVQKTVDENVAGVAEAYTDLVQRGQSLVRRVRRQQSTQAAVASAQTTRAKARTTATQARKVVGAEIAGTSTEAAASTATRTTPKKATPKKATAKKATAQKATAQKSTARKSTATSSPVQSSAKATVTAAQKTAANAVQAVTDAAEKVGD